MADPLKMGFILPAGDDYLRLGDDAIRQNAQAAADGITAAKPILCLRREAGAWVWDRSSAATHYVIPDHTGALVVRSAHHPVPDASPSFTW